MYTYMFAYLDIKYGFEHLETFFELRFNLLALGLKALRT